MNSALVTGAAGLLGKATVDRLASSGVEVHALVRSKKQAFRDDVQFHEVDLAKPLYSDSLPSRIDAIFHLAQAREFRDFPNSALSVFSINVESTVFLLDYARMSGASSFIYASSGGVYRGDNGGELVEEASLKTPSELGYYLATKLSSEALVGSYSESFATVALRYFFIYGAGQSRSMLIPRLYDRVRNGEPISLQGETGMKINPINVLDASVATIAAANTGVSGTFNIAGPEVLTLREIAEIVGNDSGQNPVLESVEGEPLDLVASTAKMRTLLIPPKITLQESLSAIRT